MNAPAVRAGELVWPPDGPSPLRAAYWDHLKDTWRVWSSWADRPELPWSAEGPRVAALARRALRLDPGRTLACFSSPALGAPVHCWDRRERWPGREAALAAAFAQTFPHLLLELAARDLLPAEKQDWGAGAPSLASAGLGVVLRPPAGARGWRFGPGTAAVLEASGEGASVRLNAASLARGRREVRGLKTELAFVPLRGSIRLALVDSNPIADFEEHPDKAGNALDLGGRSEDDWRSALATALDWVAAHAPGLAAEMEVALRQVVPVGFDDKRHLSASYREAVGTVYMTLHPQVLVLAEALVHEFQHNKLNLASRADPLLENAFHPLYKSPVRPDPRPLWGVLLAVHAFLAVAALYRRMRDGGHPAAKTPDFARRLGEVDLKNREGMDLLRAHARWTPAGREVMDALEELDRRHIDERSAAGLGAVPASAHDD